MPKDPNAKLQKAITKKLLEAAEWRKDAREAKRLGDHDLAEILEARAKKSDVDRMKLQQKLK